MRLSFALICGLSLAFAPVSSPLAIPVLNGATQCQPANGSGDTILRADFGVGTFPDGNSPQLVVCSLPGPPPAASATMTSYIIDGSNRNGAATSCAVLTFDAAGALLASNGFLSAAASYSITINVAAGQFPVNGHAVLRCLLPGSQNGFLRGVTAAA